MRRQSFKRRKGWKICLIAITMLAIATATVIVLSFFVKKEEIREPSETTASTVVPVTVSSNVLFTGNTYWGRYINDWSMASPLKYAYPFSRLNEFNRASYDAWISGLECPTVAGVSMASAEEDATLQFNCSPDYLPEAAKWFTAFTLANNHTDNQGAEGFSETKQHLEENGIQYFGHYDPREIDDICEVIALPVTVQKDDDSTEKGYLPVAMCAFHAVFRIPTAEAVAEIEKYTPYMPVIAFPHMGAEYKSAPDELKISFYHSLIDAGADMILGDHPHWIQPSESYKGHLIMYSMGNFMFDQQDTAEVVRSAGVRVVMKTTDNSDLLEQWLQFGEECATFKDGCLAEIQEQNLQKLNISYQFEIIGTDDSNKIVKPASAEKQASILQRLNWQNTVTQLQVPYTGIE